MAQRLFSNHQPMSDACIYQDLETGPLMLRWMSPSFLRWSLDGDLARASDVLGMQLDNEWLSEKSLMRLRLDQCEMGSAYPPWSLRAIGLRATGQMVGHIGFHTAPGPTYLQPYAPQGVELGYTVFSGFRRRGFARLAIGRMIRWAANDGGVPSYIVSVSPQNVASMTLARGLGFVTVATHIDALDGLEEIMLLEGGPLETLLEREHKDATT